MNLHARHEGVLKRDIANFLKHQAEHAISNLHEGVTDAGELFDPEEWRKPLEKACERGMLQAMYAGALYERMKYKSAKYDGITVELPENVRQKIREVLDEVFREPYWQDINTTTLQRIQQAINNSVDKTLPDLVEAIRQEVHSQDRALTIARTEITGALNAGAHEARNELIDEGVVAGSVWDSTLDNDTRRIPRDTFDHVMMEGQVAKGKEWFDVSGEKAPYPGYHKLSAGNRCNCRCSTRSEVEFD